MEQVTIFTHGSAKNNPGPAAIGIQILDAKGAVLKDISEAIGNATNYYAGYFAVIRALQDCAELFGDKTNELHFELILDDELVKKQLNGESQINDVSLIGHFVEIHNLRVASFPNLTFTHVRPELNKEADRLANEALGSAQ